MEISQTDVPTVIAPTGVCRNIALNELEQKIVAYFIDVNDAMKLGLTIRFAGGWVRDKLLGLESSDIDVALDKMTGQQFCKAAGLYAAVVAAKPEQSKHLETAIITLFDHQVEITNLRDESWAGAYANTDDRILTENRFGTPKIDAERRDFTVNSLLYNIHTGEVEDYCGGLADLGFVQLEFGHWERQFEQVILRTPLDPLITFKDDPLRMLRGVRFRGKLPNAALHGDVLEAMQNPLVHQAFRDKVTNERIAVELIGKQEKGGYKSGIVTGNRVSQSLKFLYYSGLLDIMFDVPAWRLLRPFASDQNNSHHTMSVFHHSLAVMQRLQNHPYFLVSLTPHRRHMLLFAALLHDVGKLDPATTQLRDVDGVCRCSYKKHEESSAVTARAICNKLRFSDDDTYYVCRVIEAHMFPHSQGWGDDTCLLRFIQKYEQEWKDIIVHAECDSGASGFDRPEDSRYGAFVLRGIGAKARAEEKAALNKPVIDGNLIVQMYPEMRQGPWIKWVVNQLNEMRLVNPELGQEDYLKAARELRPQVLVQFGAWQHNPLPAGAWEDITASAD